LDGGSPLKGTKYLAEEGGGEVTKPYPLKEKKIHGIHTTSPEEHALL